MAKRKILAELVEGVEAMKKHREGKLTLRSYKVDLQPLPAFQVHPGDSEADALFAGRLCAEAAD